MASPVRRIAPGRRARPPGEDAREHLLDAATALLSARGVANTTIAQIAAAAGVTSAMVHYWFETRERLLDAVVDERVARAIHEVWDAVDPAADAPLGQAQGIVKRMFDVTEQMPWLASLWLHEIVGEGGLLRGRALKHVPRKTVEAFGRSIARGMARGELNARIDPQLLFTSILALVMLPQAAVKIWQRLRLPASLARANLERHVNALLEHGLRGDAAVAVPTARRQRRRAS